MPSKFNILERLSVKNIFIFIIILLGGIQVMSFALTSIFPAIPLFKSGTPLLFISILLTFIFLAFAVFRGQFEKSDIIGFIIVGGFATLVFIYGSTVFPAIFSIFDNSAIESAQQLQAFLNLP